MKINKLNNKGMTAIEILVTFVIIVVIVASMYDGIMALRTRETIASYKLSLVTYKNLLTKEIQDDLIKTGLLSATTETLTEGGKSVGYRILLNLKDGSRKVIEIKQVFGCTAVDELEVADLCTNLGIPKTQGDDFSISYGPEGNLTEYPLPDLGHEELSNYGSSGSHMVYSLKIDKVEVSTANNVFSLKIILSHPDLGTRHSIDIVSPINY